MQCACRKATSNVAQQMSNQLNVQARRFGCDSPDEFSSFEAKPQSRSIAEEVQTSMVAEGIALASSWPFEGLG